MCTTVAVSSHLNLPYNISSSLLTLSAILGISMNVLEGNSCGWNVLENSSLPKGSYSGL